MIAAFLNPDAVVHSPEMYPGPAQADGAARASTAADLHLRFSSPSLCNGNFFLLKVTDITFWEMKHYIFNVKILVLNRMNLDSSFHV